MTIPVDNQPPPTVAPRQGLPFVDIKTGCLSETGMQVLQQLYGLVNGMNRIIPCNSSNAGNVYTLTMLSVSPIYKKYASYDTFAFLASAANTGNVTAKVVTSAGTLATLPVLHINGTQLAANDILAGSQYFFTFSDGYGPGFVSR